MHIAAKSCSFCCKSGGRQPRPTNAASIIVFGRGFLCQPNVLRLHTRIEKLDFEDLIRDFPVLLDQRMPVSHGCACLCVWPAGSAALPQPSHDVLRRPGFESKRRSPGILRRAPAILCNTSMPAALAPRLGCEQGQPTSRLRGDVLQARDRGVSTGRRCRGAAVLIGLGCPEFSHLFWNVGDEYLDRTTAERRVMRACYPLESLTDVWRLVPATG